MFVYPQCGSLQRYCATLSADRMSTLGTCKQWRVGKQIAETCLNKAKDLSGLLLLYTARGSAKGLESLAPDAEEAGRANIAFLSLFLLGRISECVDLLIASNRIPEVRPWS